MFFLLSKSLGILVDPGVLLTLAIVAASLARLARWRRLAVLFQGCALAIILAFGILPGGVWLALPLEERFPIEPPLPDKVAGVIALGGTERLSQTATWGQPTLSDPSPIAALVALGRRYPEAQLVFSGGARSPRNSALSEADIVRGFLAEMGLDNKRIVYEDTSRPTYENAVRSRDLIHPKPGDTWILVTQAISMPRAVGVFRKAGWSVIPYPAGYLSGSRSGEPSFDVLGGLRLAALALHEWAGLLAYRAMGYTDALFPDLANSPH